MKRAVLLLCLVTIVGCKSKSDPADKPADQPPATPRQPETPPAPKLDATKFDKSCKVATDCVVVKSATCDPCACPGEAIASSAMGTFDEANSALSCPPPDLEKMKCAPCPAKMAACEAGACVAIAKP